MCNSNAGTEGEEKANFCEKQKREKKAFLKQERSSLEANFKVYSEEKLLRQEKIML